MTGQRSNQLNYVPSCKNRSLASKPCGARFLQVLRIEHLLAIMFPAAAVPALIDNKYPYSCENYLNTAKWWRGGGRLARLRLFPPRSIAHFHILDYAGRRFAKFVFPIFGGSSALSIWWEFRHPRRQIPVCKFWCERGDSNPHGFTRQILSLCCIVINA